MRFGPLVLTANLLSLLWVASVAMGEDSPSAAAPRKPGVMPHDMSAKEYCTSCHSGAVENVKAIPPGHYTDLDTCIICHAESSPMQHGFPARISHALTGREKCLTCHGGKIKGIPSVSPYHKGFEETGCTLCHAAPEPGAAVTAATAPVLPHSLQGRGPCLICHGGKMPGIVVVPKDHAGFDNGSCLYCHAVK